MEAVLGKQYKPEFVPTVQKASTGRGSVAVQNFDTMFTKQQARDSLVHMSAASFDFKLGD